MRELPLLGAPDGPFDAEEVSHVDLPDELEELRGHLPLADAHLDADAILDQLQEGELPEGTNRPHPARNRRRGAFGFQSLRVLSVVETADLGDGCPRTRASREGIDPFLPQRRQPRQPSLPFPLTHSGSLEEAELQSSVARMKRSRSPSRTPSAFPASALVR